MKFRTFSYAAVIALFFLVWVAPASAQFEVSPDHFDGAAQQKAKPNHIQTRQAAAGQTSVNAKAQPKVVKPTTKKRHVPASHAGTATASNAGVIHTAN